MSPRRRSIIFLRAAKRCAAIGRYDLAAAWWHASCRAHG